MKILLLNHFPLTGSGSGIYTETVANDLVKKGHEICIIMPENRIIEKNINYKIHPVYFKDKDKIENCLPFNFPCFTTHPRSNKTFYDLTDEELNLYIKAFDEAIKEEIENFKPDIIHSGHIWILPSLVSKYDIPLIITTHGTDLIGYQNDQRFKKYAVTAFNKAKYIITISKENQNKIENIFHDKNKTIFIPNGYDENKFFIKNVDKISFLQKLNINKKYNHIISFVGKFTHIKGIDVLLKAASIYEKDDILTLLAGDGEDLDKMKKLANKLNLKNIVFLGNQPHDTLNDLYNIADVSLVPSRSEAFGLVVIEALACGTPVIGSNIGGIPDIINDKVGILFESDDYNELANKVNEVLNNKEKFDKKYISKYAKDNYSQDNFSNQLIEIYESCLKN